MYFRAINDPCLFSVLHLNSYKVTVVFMAFMSILNTRWFLSQNLLICIYLIFYICSDWLNRTYLTCLWKQVLTRKQKDILDMNEISQVKVYSNDPHL